MLVVARTNLLYDPNHDIYLCYAGCYSSMFYNSSCFGTASSVCGVGLDSADDSVFVLASGVGSDSTVEDAEGGVVLSAEAASVEDDCLTVVDGLGGLGIGFR
jgi:hypothetical protein